MRNSLLDGYIAARAKSDFAALEVVGGLTACTKLGNDPNNRRVPDIMKGLGAIAEVEWTILQQSMQSILTGDCNCLQHCRAIARDLHLCCQAMKTISSSWMSSKGSLRRRAWLAKAV